jgi:hypothetical protein
MEIDLSLYPKHDWEIQYYNGFFDLNCKYCHYYIRERYNSKFKDGKYIRFGFHNYSESYNVISGNITNEMRKLPLSCEEVLIKKLLE